MNIARLRDSRLFKRTAALALGGTATWLALVLLMSVVTHGRDTQQAGWGAEAIGVFVEQAQTLSPIALANACGLGASSCARCHSGRRADAPVSDAETAPWHHDHGNVNYSCTGCHQGNPRVLKQDIAHRNLIADPRADAGKQCVSCHAAADIGALVQRYVLNPPSGHPVSNEVLTQDRHRGHFQASFRRAPLRIATFAALTAGLCGTAQAGPVLKFGDEGELQLNYALQAWAQNRSYTSADHDGSQYDAFLRRNRITLSGQVNDLIGFYAQLEAGNDSKDGNDDRSVFFRDAYITIDYADAARFIVGRFKNTFSRENLEGCLDALTLDRGDISYTPFAGTRDTGAAVWGNLADAAFQYRLMIADGREGESVPRSSPRVTARVHWSPLDAEYDYGYRGTYLGTRKVLTIGAAYDYQSGAAYSDSENGLGLEDYQAWTVDGFLEYPFSSGTWTLSAAYFDYGLGNAINQSPDPDLPFNTETQGFYAKAGYLLPNPVVGGGRLQVFARHDDIAYQLTGDALDRSINTVGINYYIDGQRLKLTLEHQRVDYANPDPSNFALQDYHQTTLGLQFSL